MIRYRIVRRAGFVQPTKAVYDVERRELWWWEKVGIAYLSIESAKARIQELKEADANPIKPTVVHQETMTQEHPITPPPEFVEQWDSECESDVDAAMYLATQAACWGADQELEACIKLLSDLGGDGEMIRRYRRKPTSLKEQALNALDEEHADMRIQNYNLIRSVLESLPD